MSAVMPTAPAPSAAWAPFSADYTRKVFCPAQFAPTRERVIAAVRPSRVLDLGCGPVPFVLRELARQRGFRLYGSDFSPEMLEGAREFLRGEEVVLELADHRDLPFQDGFFDSVFSINSILPESRSDIDLMMREVRRVLKPNGRFVALLPAFETSLMAGEWWGMQVRVDPVEHREFDTTGWQCFYTAEDVDQLLVDHNLAAVERDRVEFRTPEEIDAIRTVYGREVTAESLLKHPLFEHFVVAEKRS
jgi:ubiquinone/menaquinone biosynthesis C-methylase UbiE